MLIDGLKRLFGFGGGGPGAGRDEAGGVGGPPDCDGHDHGDGSHEMISCADAMSKLQEFIDGELHGLTHEQVEAHFDVCTRCYPHLTMEKNFRVRVQAALAKPDVPERLRTRVMDMLARDGGEDGE